MNQTLNGDSGADILRGELGDDHLDGGDGADRLFGGDGDDMLSGKLGDDMLSGGNRQDALHGYHGEDTLQGGAGHDHLFGGDDNDTLEGGSGNDVLFGGNGDDVLRSSGGQDRLRGGSGADKFAFTGADLVGGIDTIVDFNRPEGDLIDISLIDAIQGGAEDAFTLIGTDDFSGAAGELRFRHVYSAPDFRPFTLLEADRNGDGLTDLVIRMQGIYEMQTGDFVL